MRVWVAIGILSLQASLSLAAGLPDPVTHAQFPVPGATSVLLGRDLFYDPVLSGNRDTSCASCHIPGSGTTTGLSPVQVATGTTARNIPALYNLGSYEFTAMLHDGRVARDSRERFRIRLPDDLILERPLPSPLAAQTLVSLVSPGRMAGYRGENPVADAVADQDIMGLDGAWQMLAERIEATPDYRRRFSWLIGAEEPIHITDIARVLGDFITFEFRASDSPFDAFLAGADEALNNAQLRGMSLFYGKANCASCHSGPFQTDQQFHAIGLPQIGPGMGGSGDGLADYGRGAITGQTSDMYRFRTPSLRNVALTAPYGHSGAYADLSDMIRHHLDAETALAEYLTDMARLPAPDEGAMADFDEVLRIATAIEIDPVALSDTEIAALVAFLAALTDPVSLKGRLGAPTSVPSDLLVGITSNPPS